MRSSIAFIKDMSDYPLVGAEIGVYKGDHSQEILDNLNVKQLLLVDIWSAYELALSDGNTVMVDYSGDFVYVTNRFAHDGRVIIHKAPSIEIATMVANDSLDFVYIDGCHNYENVKEDINIWYKKVRPGGVVSGHDYENINCIPSEKFPGVKAAVDGFALEKGLKIFIGGDKLMDWWFVRPEYK